MRKINEYLKHQALLEKKYTNARLIPGSVNENGIINNINESYTELSFENIDNYITDSLCTSYFTDNAQGYWDNIFETLIKSHNSEKLVKALKKYFGNKFQTKYDINSMVKSNTKSFEMYLDNCEEAKTIEKYVKRKLYKEFENTELPKELSDIMNFYNYYFSKVTPSYFDGEISSYKIVCEPKYSDKVNDIVYKEYKGILYHVTTNENVNRLLKRGLQVKGDTNMYRYIEPRINFYLADDEDVEKIGKLIALQKKYKDGSYTILKIDLNYGEKNKFNNSSYSIDFYHDNMYDNDYFVYTYGLIHPRFISIYKQNLNESRGKDIDEQWLNDDKPVMTKDGRPVIVVSIDMKQVPNVIKGKVKQKDKLFDFEWNDDGTCIKCTDSLGNPKKPEEVDNLVKAE